MTSPDNGVIGSPRLPIKQAFVSTVLDLLVAGANQLRAKQTVTPEMAEDHISHRLDEEMEAIHRGSQSDIVNWSMRPSTRTALSNPDAISQVDFMFHWNQLPRDQRRHLGVEAKRLRGTGPSLAGVYVEKGVIRFVSGRYGQGHDYAVMIGYVVVAPVVLAVSRVKIAMAQRSTVTRQCSELTVDHSLCSYEHTYISGHIQDPSSHPLTMAHLFLNLGTRTQLSIPEGNWRGIDVHKPFAELGKPANLEFY